MHLTRENVSLFPIDPPEVIPNRFATDIFWPLMVESFRRMHVVSTALGVSPDWPIRPFLYFDVTRGFAENNGFHHDLAEFQPLAHHFKAAFFVYWIRNYFRWSESSFVATTSTLQLHNPYEPLLLIVEWAYPCWPHHGFLETEFGSLPPDAKVSHYSGFAPVDIFLKRRNGV